MPGGIFSDEVRKLDDEYSKPFIVPSQGIHIVLDKAFLPGDTAIMVPHTDDGRVLFAIPWKGKVIVGTTETKLKNPVLEPVPFPEELNFLLEHASKYLSKDPGPEDILSVFAGIRPLVSMGDDENTAAISRDHTINISRSGLISIAGGKWTTYRKMAEDTVDQACLVGELDPKVSKTENIKLHGYSTEYNSENSWSVYGTDAQEINKLINSSGLSKKLHPKLPYLEVEVIWAVRYEMARTIEDFLARRSRALLLDARASQEISKRVADLMAGELGMDKVWITRQLEEYKKLSGNYIAFEL